MDVINNSLHHSRPGVDVMGDDLNHAVQPSALGGGGGGGEGGEGGGGEANTVVTGHTLIIIYCTSRSAAHKDVQILSGLCLALALIIISIMNGVFLGN